MSDDDEIEPDEEDQADPGPLPPVNGTSIISGFVTYAGEGFALVRAGPERGEHPEPTPAHSRRYLRAGLPAIYQEDDFAMRLVGAFERALDPIVALLDNLPAHFSPELAPLDILDLSTQWLGIERNESQPSTQVRTLVRRAAELGRLRGTRAGVELALALNFPDLALRVQDNGGVVYAVDGEPPTPAPPSFVVYCDEPISADVAATVSRVIEAVKPAHVSFKLRVKGPR
jgi:phage tail-like protein